MREEIIRWMDSDIKDDTRDIVLEMLIDHYWGEVQVHEDEGEHAEELEHLEALRGAIQTLDELRKGTYLLVKVEE